MPPSNLPPNTGPPGSVSSNNGNSTKNLSHVPCKFFKQGVCQAGSTCPFSHNLEGTTAADKLPCKYFQKGNCKFGLKCALAHFLPDGTRVNSKNYRRSSHGNHRDHHANPPSSSAGGSGGNSSASVVSAPASAGSSTTSFSAMTTPIDISQNLLSKYNNVANFVGFSLSSNLVFSKKTLTSPLLGAVTLQSPSSFQTSHISPPTSYKLAFPSRWGMAHLPTYFSTPNDSAVVDDDDDEEDNYEDYVPGSLGDLILTPQEMQRRDLRSQLGTLLVRPCIPKKDKPHEDVFLMD